jgi:hypothetical protein
LLVILFHPLAFAFDQRTRDVKSRMREIRTSGSVGAREGDLPWLPDQYVVVDIGVIDLGHCEFVSSSNVLNMCR